MGPRLGLPSRDFRLALDGLKSGFALLWGLASGSGIGGYARINGFLRHGALYDHIASLCKRNFSQLCWRLVVASVTDFEGLPFAGFSNACPFQVLSRPVLHQGFPRFRSSLHKGLGIVTVQPITSVPFNAIVTATTTLAAATAAMMA